MFTTEKVLALVAEMEIEEKKTERVPHYYTRKGQILERSYPDYKYTARYEELFFDREKKLLRSEDAKIFTCRCCGEKVGYFDLEAWCCDFDNDSYICSACYEDEMGEDL